MGLGSFILRLSTEYGIQDGMIREMGCVLRDYSYFDFYDGNDDLIGEGQVRKEDLVSLFRTQMTQDEKIYVTFASLDLNDQNQILNWIRLFGLPFKQHNIPSNQLGNLFQRELKGGAEINKIKDEIALMKWVLSMFSIFKSKLWVNIDIDEETDDLLCRNNIISPKSHKLWTDKAERVDIINSTIKSIFSRQLENIHPEIVCDLQSIHKSQISQNLNSDWDLRKSYSDETCLKKELIFSEDTDRIAQAVNNPFKCDYPKFMLNWSFPSLLSVMYLHMALDVNNSALPISCANNRCKKYFSPTKASQRFCSSTCRNRDNQQKRWRKLKSIID